MGCDIHAIWQTKSLAGAWVDVTTQSKWQQERDYKLFGWLAGVRGDEFIPISEPRGLPRDFEFQDIEEILGDHSHSWLNATEILDAAQTLKSKKIMPWDTGIMTIADFKCWDGIPRSFRVSEAIYGSNLVLSLPSEVNERTTHVKIFWKTPTNSFDYFVKEVERMQSKFGNIRLVFGFVS